MIVARGVIWPLLLILTGIAFLLASFGYLPPINFGRVITLLWPLLLIIAGLELALARRRPLAAVVLQILVIAAGLALLSTRPDVARVGGGDGPVAQAVTVERGDARSAMLRFAVGAGRFELAGGATALLEARSRNADLEERVTRAGDRVEVRLQQEFSGFSGGDRSVTARVASDIPMELRIESGAGDFRIDLGDVKATDVRIETGASSLTLVLPRPSGHVPVRIDAGASSIVVEVPAGVEAKVTTSGGLISTSGRTETTGYAAAKDRVTVTVQAGASSVTVR